jgi:c-di-GMP-binding flagellar brake protein YcgR
MGAAKKQELGKNAFFSLIKTQSERKALFHTLTEAQGAVVIKGLDEEPIAAKALRQTESGWLVCELDSPSPRNFATLKAAPHHIVNFKINSDQYFFQSAISFSKNGLLLETIVELFQLQRRSSYRLTLPDQLGAFANIIQQNGNPYFLDAKILDYSTGGLRLQTASGMEQLKLDDQLTLAIHLGNRIPFQLEAKIKFSSKKNESMIYGIEFINKTSLIENKLVALQLDMQSEIFRKWTRGQVNKAN